MSTGPTGGSGGTTGPGHFLRGFIQQMRTSRARADKAAREAGARSTSAKPLTDEQRRDNYRRQNGAEVGGRLTPRQQRRADHRAARAAGRSA
ncbi:hypothetical protein M3G91_29800 [Micromonospora chalcea]|uniref:hypothetical protein n=1 Tax=Micromonospora chalcea TaxID=1874 RepID=UPI0021A566DA|nr:hypothetical protein [Micromonospora chalcea]MCT2281797.1 hypothetical protein [Micromonospora chalcea]